MNNTALAVRTDIDELQTIGQVFVKSGYFQDARDAAQAIVKVMAGAELGFPAIASMTGVYIVKGKVSLSANLMAAAIKRSGKYNYRVRQLDDAGCRIEFFENGESIGLSEFTRDDAQKAGLLGADTWKKFFRNMCFARTLSNGAKWFTPDIFGGPIYTPEELGATVDGETGEVIEMPVEAPVIEVFGPNPSEAAQDLQAHLIDQAIEVEPVHLVKLEGAQPAANHAGELPELEGAAGHVVALAKKLKWSESALARCIEANFGLVVMPGKVKDYLQFANKDELRELYRIMNSQQRGGKR